MKIAHILWSLLTGGTENLVVDIANIQSETEDVAIFVINNEIKPHLFEKINPRCKVFLINRSPKSRNIVPLIKLNYLIRRFNPDIIHAHSARSIYCIWGLKNIPKVRTIHGMANPSNEYPVYKRLFAISDAVKQYTKGQGFDCKTIYNGIDFESINNQKQPFFSDKKFHIVQVSRLEHIVKGQDTVLSSLQILKDRGISDIIVHFIGNGGSWDFLHKMAKDLGVEEMVVFEGEMPQRQIYKILSRFDLFIQASRQEGFGLTIVEAMAAKLPVLVSDIPAQMEVIGFGKYGDYFKVDDSKDLAEKIEFFVTHPEDGERESLAREFAEENYSLKGMVEKYLEEYREFLT